MTARYMFVKKFSLTEKVLFFSYCIVLIGLFLYSFTQIDLSLTFSRITFLRNLVKSFQYIGYFNRHLSTDLYVFFLILLFGFYFAFLYLCRKGKIKKKLIWTTIIAATVILTFSYNAFSYDFFNYIFDAKIVTHYYQNPYIHKALDYPRDPMLSFMHWTHRTFPYGPVWLVLTVPLSFLGFGFFLPTFFLFKALIAISYLGSIYYIGKIFQKINKDSENFGIIFWGLQPMVLIECLISGHLDIVMIFFSIWAFYRLIEKKLISSGLLFAASIGIKFATILILPVFLWVGYCVRKKKQIHWTVVFFLSTILLIGAMMLEVFRTNFQPWYLLVPLSFAAFIGNKYYIFIPSIIVTFCALLTYVPFLYLGNWDPPVPLILSWIYGTSYAFSILCVVFYRSVVLYKHAKRNCNAELLQE